MIRMKKAIRFENLPQVSQHHGSAEDHGRWVGFVRASDVLSNMTTSWLEKSVFLENHGKKLSIYSRSTGSMNTYPADVTSWDDTWSTNKSSTNVGYYSSVEIRHNHDIELTGLGYELHGGVVDNHIVGDKARRLIFFGDFVESAEEQAVSELHNVGFMNASNFL
jgi:hypothetical protein